MSTGSAVSAESAASAESAVSAESGELAEPMELTEPVETVQLRAEVNGPLTENRLLRESAEAAKAAEDAWKRERDELQRQVAQLRPGVSSKRTPCKHTSKAHNPHAHASRRDWRA